MKDGVNGHLLLLCKKIPAAFSDILDIVLYRETIHSPVFLYRFL